LVSVPHRGQYCLHSVCSGAKQDSSPRICGDSPRPSVSPFPLRGVDSDNRSEFTDDQLYRYYDDEESTFTPGRAGKKNDNPHIEQKNRSVLRRAVGYYCHNTPEQPDLLNRLYAVLHFYVSFSLPVTKLEEKLHLGSRVKRAHNHAQAPFGIVLASPDVYKEHNTQLRETYALLDLVRLRREISQLQTAMLSRVSTK